MASWSLSASGEDPEKGGRGQGDGADGDDLAAPVRQPAGQQRGQDQEAADDHAVDEQPGPRPRRGSAGTGAASRGSPRPPWVPAVTGVAALLHDLLPFGLDGA